MLLDSLNCRQEAVFLRSNDTVELYDVTEGKYQFITKYQMESGKANEMRSISLTWGQSAKDAVVLFMPRDKVRSQLK